METTTVVVEVLVLMNDDLQAPCFKTVPGRVLTLSRVPVPGELVVVQDEHGHRAGTCEVLVVVHQPRGHDVDATIYVRARDVLAVLRAIAPAPAAVDGTPGARADFYDH